MQKGRISKFIESIFFLKKRSQIYNHRIDEGLLREVNLWDYEDPNGWMENQDYVLTKNNAELDSYEKLERQVIAAEYAICREIALVGGVIIDIGCGVGRHIIQIASSKPCNAKKIIGVDFSPNLLKKTHIKSKNYSNIVELHLASADKLYFIPDHSVDYGIIMYRTFGNLPGEVKEKHLREIKRILKKDGYYILSLGNKKFMETVMRKYHQLGGPTKYYNKKKGDIIYGSGVRQHYFDKKELKKYFAQRHFEIVRLYEAGTNFIVWTQVKR